MIPRDFITEWRADAPWKQDAQVEQDLVITRALVEMFRVDGVAEALAFRGGTALYKLYLRPGVRGRTAAQDAAQGRDQLPRALH